MSDTKLGTVPERLNTKDAVHVAVMSVCATQRLHLGQRVHVAEAMYLGHFVAGPDPDELNNKALMTGIVDPFRSEPPNEGDYFWLLIPPGEISNLTHVWTHPQLPEIAPVDAKDIYDGCAGC